MSSSLRIFCFLLTVKLLSSFLLPEENILFQDITSHRQSLDNRDFDMILDDESDIGYGWEITHNWFEYVNNVSGLEEYPEWGNRSWLPFASSYGIWALFYREPPESHASPPSFDYMTINGLTHIEISFYLEGNSSIEIYGHYNPYDPDDVELLSTLENTQSPGSGFRQEMIALVKEEEFVKIGFNLTLRVNSPKDLILIDWIKSTRNPSTIPPPPETTTVACEPNVMLDNKYEDLGDTWTVKEVSNMLEYFDHTVVLEDWWKQHGLENGFPTDFDFTPFEKAQGIWLLYNETNQDDDFGLDDYPDPNLPSFVFLHKDHYYDTVDIVCYLHGDSSLSVYYGKNEAAIEVGSGEVGNGWQDFTIILPSNGGVSTFTVQGNIKNKGDFVFIDKMTAIPFNKCTDPTTTTPWKTTTTTIPTEITSNNPQPETSTSTSTKTTSTNSPTTTSTSTSKITSTNPPPPETSSSEITAESIFSSNPPTNSTISTSSPTTPVSGAGTSLTQSHFYFILSHLTILFVYVN